MTISSFMGDVMIALEYTIDTTVQVTGLVSRGTGMIASVAFVHMFGA